MIGLLAKKVGMTQLFDEQGEQVPVTVLEVGPCKVSDVKSKAKHGYSAVQLAFDACKEKVLNKPKVGHLKKAGLETLRYIREIRTEETEGLKVGTELRVDNFQAGDWVDVEGTSIGHGFQGVVKRHHFKGAQTFSHGDMSRRRPGSIGASSFPSRVMKGMRMHGQMGNKKITVQNLKVVKVDEANNLLLIKGSVPGFEGRYLIVRTALKKGAKRKWKVQGNSPEQAPAAASKEAAGNTPESEKS